MATLIMAESKDGKIGRCDARCHTAKNPRCNCICGGKLHGGGIERALERVPEVVEDLKKQGFIHIRNFPYQLSFFN